MIRGTAGQDEGASPDGWAPWGTKRRMLMMAIVGPVLAVVLLALGVYYLITNGRHGEPLTVIGGILVIVFALAIPLARRRGKI
jgi:hypothetical protein